MNFLRRFPNRHFTYGYILLFALVILGVGFATLISMAIPMPANFQAAVDGTWSGRVEQEFDKAIPFSDALISVWTSAGYLITGRGMDGVFIGEGGRLYSAEEWYENPDGGKELLESISWAADELGSRGIGLIILPVPAKNQIYPDAAVPAIPDGLVRSYASFLRGLERRGIASIDLQGVFGENARRIPLFLRGDTHWTPEGARLAAAATADLLRREGMSAAFPEAEFASVSTGQREHRGDLFEFLPGTDVRFGPFLRRLPDIDRISTWENRTISAAVFGLFDTPSIPVALVGTSYSAGSAWNFEGFLREALSADLISFAREGEGPLEPMRRALDADSMREYGVSVVIWEIPVRYLGVVPESWETGSR
jgi:alginate O-acetyltransferase complex protein AlgJ